VPLKGNVSIDKSKMRSPAMIYPRGESLDALQAIAETQMTWISSDVG
jgi:hypothetical protein